MKNNETKNPCDTCLDKNVKSDRFPCSICSNVSGGYKNRYRPACECNNKKTDREKAFHDFMKDQIETILRDKYLDSEKAGHDLGPEGYTENWIRRNAKKFREIWIAEHGEVL
jgi:hypothetical protein